MRSLLPARRSSTAVEVRGNPLENPGVPLSSVGLLQLFGGTPTDSGVSMDEEGALGIATYWRCSMLLSQVVAGFPLNVYKTKGKVQVANAALQVPATGTPFEQMETIMLHLLGWGNAYVQKIRGGLGQIVDLQPIYPGRVHLSLQPTRAADGTMTGPLAKCFRVSSTNGPDEIMTTFEIMHIPGPSTDGVRGMGVVERARQSLGTARAADILAAKQFGNGSLLSGMLSTDRVLKEEEATEMKSRWRDTLAGVNHAHDIFVAGAGTHFTPLSMSNEDSQFLQSRQWNAEEICRWFGIPGPLAGLIQKSTTWGTGLEQMNMSLLKFTVSPWTYRIEQRATLEIVGPSNEFAQFATEDLLRSDTATRYAAYNVAILAGWMTRAEVRAKENLPPIEGLDVPLVPTVAPPLVQPAQTDGPDAAADDGSDDADDTDGDKA